MDCTHCWPVDEVYAAASALADWPVSEDLYGMYGPHHESVATLLTSGPSATVSAGKSSTFATVASFGLKPCWDACFQKALKSGGSGALLYSSQCLLLNVPIIEVKSEVPSWYAPPSTTLYLDALISGSNPPRNALPSESFGYMQATVLSVLIRFHMGTNAPCNCSRPKKNRGDDF